MQRPSSRSLAPSELNGSIAVPLRRRGPLSRLRVLIVRAFSLVSVYARMLLLICLGQPYKLTLLVSGGCNLRCRICSIWQQPQQAISSHELRTVWATFAIKPCWVNISGGEPSLNRELESMLSFLVDLGRPLLITLTTNGYADCSAMMERVLRRNSRCCFYMSVSIDGEDRDHDAARGVPGSCARAWRTYHHLCGLRACFPMLAVGISTTLSRVNYRQVLPFIRRVLAARIPISINLSQASSYYQNSKEMGFSLLPAAELAALLRAIQYLLPKLSLDSVLKINFLEGAIRYLQGRYRPIPCTSLVHHVLITSELTVVDCTLDFRSMVEPALPASAPREKKLRAVVGHIRKRAERERTQSHCVHLRGCPQHCHTPCEKYVHLISGLLRPQLAPPLVWNFLRICLESRLFGRRYVKQVLHQFTLRQRSDTLRLVA